MLRLRLASLLFGAGIYLGLAACGAGGDCAPAAQVAMSWAILEPGMAGKTTWGCGRDTLVEIDHSTPRVAVQRIIEHELGHAKGLGHIDDTACVMRSPPYLQADFCDAEVDGALAYGPISKIVVLDEDLRDITVDAATRWNEAAGKTIFEVE